MRGLKLAQILGQPCDFYLFGSAAGRSARNVARSSDSVAFFAFSDFAAPARTAASCGRCHGISTRMRQGRPRFTVRPGQKSTCLAVESPARPHKHAAKTRLIVRHAKETLSRPGRGRTELRARGADAQQARGVGGERHAQRLAWPPAR